MTWLGTRARCRPRSMSLPLALALRPPLPPQIPGAVMSKKKDRGRPSHVVSRSGGVCTRRASCVRRTGHRSAMSVFLDGWCGVALRTRKHNVHVLPAMPSGWGFNLTYPAGIQIGRCYGIVNHGQQLSNDGPYISLAGECVEFGDEINSRKCPSHSSLGVRIRSGRSRTEELAALLLSGPRECLLPIPIPIPNSFRALDGFDSFSSRPCVCEDDDEAPLTEICGGCKSGANCCCWPCGLASSMMVATASMLPPCWEAVRAFFAFSFYDGREDQSVSFTCHSCTRARRSRSK